MVAYVHCPKGALIEIDSIGLQQFTVDYIAPLKGNLLRRIIHPTYNTHDIQHTRHTSHTIYSTHDIQHTRHTYNTPDIQYTV